MSEKVFYYPRTILNLVTLFCNQFSGISCKKFDANNNVVDSFPVPINFGPINKTQDDSLEGPNSQYFDLNGNEIGKRFYETIPRMSVVLDSLQYDSSRATSSNEYRNFYAQSLSASYETFSDYIPSCYNIGCTLFIKTNSLDYMSQILESVLPYFNPSLILRVKEFQFLPSIERDIPCKLLGVNLDQSGDMQDSDQRHINCSISFSMEAVLYRPFDISNIITTINSKIFTT